MAERASILPTCFLFFMVYQRMLNSVPCATQSGPSCLSILYVIVGSRLGAGWGLGVRVPLAWSPSSCKLSCWAEEEELDYAHRPSSAAPGWKLSAFSLTFPKRSRPSAISTVCYDSTANNTCPQAVPCCMARPVCGLNIPLASGVGEPSPISQRSQNLLGIGVEGLGGN